MNAAEMRTYFSSKFPSEILQWEEKSPQRIYAEIRPASVRPVAGAAFRDLGFRFSIASGVETMEGFQVLYHFSDDRSGVFLSLRVRLGKEKPAVDSIADLVPAADWIEREMAELLGIEFKGRASTERLLTSEEWKDKKFPLRKTPCRAAPKPLDQCKMINDK
jgi:Ni,Fe-hydrogenase III component G